MIGGSARTDLDSRSTDVVSIGETMVVVTPDEDEPLEKAKRCRLSVGGAESNVLIQLARSGLRTRFVSRVGDDPFGRRVTRALADAGVDVSAVAIDRERPTGVYFKDRAQRQRAAIYYRRGSAASTLTGTAVAQARIDESHILFLTGITWALSPSVAVAVDTAVDIARGNGVAVYFDVNYRQPLWTVERAAETLLGVARRSDVVFVGRDEAHTLWNTASAAEVRRLFGSWPGRLVVKDGPTGATEFDADESVFVPTPPVTIVEEAGAGDAFAAGYLRAQFAGASPVERLHQGHRQAALALGTIDDLPPLSVASRTDR